MMPSHYLDALRDGGLCGHRLLTQRSVLAWDQGLGFKALNA